MRRALWAAVITAFVGCADSAEEPKAPAPKPVVTAEQAVLDDGPNWLIAGGPGLVELVGGTDGEPDQLTGRFALEGREIVDTASAGDKWVVAGNGITQPLDNTAVRTREARTALNGEAISFVEAAPVGFLIGGASGRLQLLDAEGEPTATELQVLSGATVTSAAYNGTAWLVGGDNGDVVVVSSPPTAPMNPAGVVLLDGTPVVAVTANPGTPGWVAFTASSAVPVSPLGNPQAATLIEAGLQITDARVGGNKIFIGTDDGRVGVADYGSSPSFAFTNVLGGAAVTKLVTNGTEWVVLGANGQAQLLDANGQTLGGPVQVSSATNRALVGAHWNAAANEWLLVVGEIGFVAFVDDRLASPRTLTPVLGGAQIRDASAGDGQVLIVGDGGNYQILDDRGATVTTPAQLGGADLLAAEWNGDDWLAAGAGGFAQRVAPDGSPAGDAQTLLDGSDIRFAAWSGEFWLIGGDGGKFQFVRSDGTASGGARTIAEAAVLHDARWSGREWLAVGETAAGEGVAAIILSDPNATPSVQAITTTGPLYAADFNGIEWLAAGAGGLIQRLSAQGMPVGDANDVLTGFDINDIYYNGLSYIVAGDFGAVRRLGQDYLPVRTPIAVVDRSDAVAVLWTVPRGFASGPCLTDALCYEGPCVGGLAAGQCCDSACDRACESCFLDDTGEPDGTCAPVVAGKRPPTKPGGPADPCPRQSEATCGFTGVCDGAGECQYFGAEVQCAEPICSLGKFTPAASCNGEGACGTVADTDCAPYKGCSTDGCLETCTSDQDCVDGFRCDQAACVEDDDGGVDPDGEGPDDGGDGGGGDGGCCATTRPAPRSAAWLLMAIGCLLVLRRPRH